MACLHAEESEGRAAHLGDVAGEEKAHYDINRGKMQTLSEENSN